MLTVFHQIKDWKIIYDSAQPHKENLPDGWENSSKIQKLIVLRCLRPDKVRKD